MKDSEFPAAESSFSQEENGPKSTAEESQPMPTLQPPEPRATPLVVGGETILPGKRLKLEIQVARLPTGTMLSLPMIVINGRRPGPRLWLSAAIHGDELNGVEIIRRVTKTIKPMKLQGAIIAVPVVNIFGLLEQSRYLPDRRDLNRSFPGSKRGSLAARIAALFMREVVNRCTHGIDLHTGAIHRTNLPQIRANLDDPLTYAFAKSFGAPIMIHSAVRDGSLREAAAKRQIPTLLYEAGEALRFTEAAIQVGVDGINRVMTALNMYPEQVPAQTERLLESRETKWVRSSRGGIWHREVLLGQRVEQGQRLGFISDALGDNTVSVRSPMPGLVIGHGQNPVVHQGDALVHIAAIHG